MGFLHIVRKIFTLSKDKLNAYVDELKVIHLSFTVKNKQLTESIDAGFFGHPVPDASLIKHFPQHYAVNAIVSSFKDI
ncbi:hypothetical protein [Paenibacillus sp. FSL L8-0709]|uniref:hypothetical protein n=1 Tax=Paenibacillus sp. FSL L8-0709 TaxID=2975312 RepID=UPI0030F957F1